APVLEWKSAAQPFRRRALIAAGYQGKLYVMGGMDEQAAVSSDVNIYDPKTGAWTKGPAIPGTGVSAFAPAAVVHHGALYVSVAAGTLYRLDSAGQKWEPAGRASARLAHRLVSHGENIYVIGCALDGKNMDSIETVPIAAN